MGSQSTNGRGISLTLCRAVLVVTFIFGVLSLLFTAWRTDTFNNLHISMIPTHITPLIKFFNINGTTMESEELPILNKTPNWHGTTKQVSMTTVLLWTPFFGNQKWGHKDLGTYPCQTMTLDTGSRPHCTVTDDKSQIQKADVVFFHCRDPILDRDKLIENRLPGQIFVVLCHESPTHSSLGGADSIGMNASATYRHDSDFPTYYGEVVPKSDTEHYIRQVAWSDKTKSVVWMTGNCHPASHRERLAKELSKYIDVDIFGSCGKRRCSQNTRQCIKDFAKDYKFYLSFENSLCHDYVTEKFFIAMAADIIPVVYGGANYSQIAPDHSFINARDFSSPKQLAEYLNQVGNNKTEYDKYLDWKKYHELIPTNPSLECTLCDAHRSQFTKMAGPLEGWWNTGACHNDHLYQWRRNWTSGQQRNWYWLNMYY